MTTAPVVPDVPVGPDAAVTHVAVPPVTVPQQPRKRYALRAVVVPASLADLRGPVAGLVELPQRLFWSGADRVFDISDRDRLLEMYEAVLDAARSQEDLAEYLDGETLAGVWPHLALSPRVRRAWESAHPRLPRSAPAVTAA